MHHRRLDPSPSGPFARIPASIREQRDQIVCDWERAMRDVGFAADRERPVLIDDACEILDRIAIVAAAKLSARPSATGRRPHDALAQVERVADARRVFRELGVLRGCVVGRVESELSSCEEIASLRALDRAMDEVVGEVMDHYLSASDRERDAAERRVADLEAVIESLPEGILIGTTQRIMRCNEAALEIAGWDSSGRAEKAPDALALEMRARDAESGEPLAPEELPFSKALRGETATREVLISREDTGEDVVVRMSAAPIRTDGEIVGAVSLSADITDEKRAEEMERESHARLQAILDFAPAAVFIRDRSGRYAFVNRWYGETFGVDPVTAPGRTVRELHPDRPSELIQAQETSDREVLDEGMPIEREDKYTIDGEERIHSLFEFPLRDSSDAVWAVCGISMDVTVRRRVEAAHDRIIAILGHDLRTPVSAILLAARMLRSADLPREAQTRIVARIASSAERMRRMISELLDFARGHLGEGIPIAPQPTDLGVIARDVLDEMTTALPGLPVAMGCVGDLSGVWDRERLAQVLGNLIGNAAQHRLDDTIVRVDLIGMRNAVHLTVKNTIAAPIEAEQLKLLFQPFQRGDGRTPTPSVGIGLGLFIVREIVRAHGGSVDARCTADCEFSIVVRLPRSAPPDDAR